MNLLIKTFLALSLLGLFTFCIFGFLATFEQLDPITQMIWRFIYTIAGFGAISAILLCLSQKRRFGRRKMANTVNNKLTSTSRRVLNNI
jgi:uncharacterized membrane protein YuzA (DUF378 family)